MLLGLWRDERVWFDMENYSRLRDSGLSHKDTVRELDRLFTALTAGR